jgi:hypothetical protein
MIGKEMKNAKNNSKKYSKLQKQNNMPKKA